MKFSAPSLSLAPWTSYVSETQLSCHDFDNFCFPNFFFDQISQHHSKEIRVYEIIWPRSPSLAPQTSFDTTTLLSCHDFDNFCIPNYFFDQILQQHSKVIRVYEILWPLHLAQLLRLHLFLQLLLSCHDFDNFCFPNFF